MLLKTLLHLSFNPIAWGGFVRVAFLVNFLDCYSERINSFERRGFVLPEGRFEPSASLAAKVDENNRFRRFYGDTIFFDLPEDIKRKAGSLCETLYRQCGECFSERLDEKTLHVTLHRLSSGNDISRISDEMFRSEIKLAGFTESDVFERTEINFQTNNIINSDDKSVVLSMKPKTESDYGKLLSLYGKADCVKVLPYPLTLHITLAYFNRNGFDEEVSGRLRRVVNILNEDPFDITLSTEELYYVKFTDMKSYYRIFPLVKNKSQKRVIRKSFTTEY